MIHREEKPVPLGGEPEWRPGQPHEPQSPPAVSAGTPPPVPVEFVPDITGRVNPAKHPDLAEHKPISFPTQRPNEHVVLLLRRNWTVLARDVIQLVASLIIPPVVLGLLYVYAQISVEPGTGLYVLVVITLGLYYLYSFLAYFHDFIDYHLDIWVVTDQRIVSIEQTGLFNRVVSELNIVRVQDVTSEIKGTIQTFLDYGQVHIQTAGQEARFVFEQVPHPSEVAKVILQVHDRAQTLNELESVRASENYRHELEQGPGQSQPAGQPLQPPQAGQQQFAKPVQPHLPQRQIPVQPTRTQVRVPQPGQIPQQPARPPQPQRPQPPAQAAAPRVAQSVRPEDVPPIQTPPPQ